MWPYVTAHRKTYMIYSGAPTQSSRCISALTCGIHHRPATLPSPATLCQYALILTYHFIPNQIYPVLHMTSHCTSITSQNTSFWLICFGHFVDLSKDICHTHYHTPCYSLKKKINSHTRQETVILPAFGPGFSFSTFHIALQTFIYISDSFTEVELDGRQNGARESDASLGHRA